MQVARNTRPVLAAVLGMVLAWPSLACAQVDEDFRDAREAYGNGQFADVIRLLEPFVGQQLASIGDHVMVREARKYLGAAYVLTGAGERARNQFRWLLEDNRDQLRTMSLDRRVFILEVRDVFEEVQADLIRAEDQANADDEAARARERELRRQALITLLHQAQEDVVEVENPELPMFVPFGVGQFMNGDDTLGTFFLVSEAFFFLAASATLSVSIYLGDLRTSGGMINTTWDDALDALAPANLVSAAVFTVLAIAGIVEARLSWQPTRTVRRRREIDQDILDRLELSASPGGIGVRF
ncbi:MAG: hypothetical protein R3B82_01265 [Sandaracinaceae bacterium]